MTVDPHTGVAVSRRSAEARSQIGPFAMLPLWLLQSPIGDKAKLLYGFIAGKYADRTTDTCYPSRRALAEDLGVSDKTIDRALAELQRIGALFVEHRKDPFGNMTTSMYTIIFNRPEGLIIEPPAAVKTGRFGA